MRRRVLRMLTVAAATSLILLTLLVAGASAQGETVGGTLTFEGEPVPAVEIVVTGEDGEVGRAVTAEDGSWEINLPSTGTYQVELLVETLPEDVALTNPDNNPLEITIRFRNFAQRVTFNLNPPIEAESTWSQFPQRLLVGLRAGLIIAMASVGLSLVFGTTGLINFAHGELVTFGAIAAWMINTNFGVSILVAAPLAMVAGAALSGVLEVGVFRGLRRRRIAGFQFLVISVGLALLIQNLLLLWFGNEFAPYEIGRQSGLDLGVVTTTPRDAAIILVSIAALVAVALMLQKTRVGKAMRAISDNRDLAESSGINVTRVVFFVWVMGGALAALGGVFQGLGRAVQYQMGFQLLLLMFAAVILGGLGTAYGAMVGGLVVGLVSELSTLWLRSEMKSAWALLILIVVLLVRPQGILGKRERFG